MGFLDRFRRPAPTPLEKAPEQKLYYYPDQLSPSIASDRDIASAIRMGILVHGPGATELTYSAYPY
jgi:hypothetical protein